ncbi:alpha-protein kinase 2 [Triplophysa dalaica]|uniref:alpha-protein kinase 2 n=1 Tax=Triplophysa dalaica TaxID=1582913 RepID=UPI0024DF5C09|nr:alpha-protein kinase 2 [Triplophysa dalaica]
MTYNVLETADGPDNYNRIILTLNNTSPDSPVYPTVESCTCFVIQTSLNPVKEPDEEPYGCAKDLPRVNVTTDNSSKHIGVKDERDLSQTNIFQTLPDTGDLGTEDTDGVSLKFTGTKRDGEVCNETWLDACQFLAGEEHSAAILDECCHSLTPGPPEADPDNTKASGFPKREDISTKWHAENWELFPSVERWSSTDSWASALSDWFQTVSTFSEDSFTSANNSSPDSKLAMAIQDTSVEQSTCPDITNIDGKTYMSVTDEVMDEEPDYTNEKQGDKDCVPSHADSDRQTDVMEDKVNLSETHESHLQEMKAVLDAFNAEMPRTSPGNFGVRQCGGPQTSGELWSAKLEGDALVFHPGSDFEEERESNSAAQRISAYTSDRNLTAGCVRGDGRHGSDSDLHTCPPQSNGDVSSEVEGLKLAQGVEADEKCLSRSFIEGNGTHTASNIENLRTVKPEEKSEFIMPFAPLSTGNTFLHHGVLKEDVSQADVSHQGIIIDTCLKPSIESGQDLKYKDESSEERFIDQSSSSSDGPSMRESGTKYSNTCDISKQLSNFILLTGERSVLSINKRVAYVTLDLDEHRDLNRSYFSNHVNAERQNCSCAAQPIKDKMPHKTSRTSDGKARSKHKDQPADPHGIHTSKKQEKPPSEKKGELQATGCEDGEVTVIETIVITEKSTPKVHGKKKKKHVQHGATKHETEPMIRATQKNTTSKTENLEIKVASNGLDKPDAHLSTREDTGDKNSTQKPMSVRPKVEASCSIVAKKMVQANTDTGPKIIAVKPKADISRIDVGKNQNHTCNSSQSTLSDEIKRRRIANDLPGTIPVKTRPQLPAIFRQARKDGEEVAKRAYSEVVKQKTPTPKEVVVPRVVSEIQAEPLPADPQNISLWCRFNPVPHDATIKWTKEGTVLSESKKGEGDDQRSTLIILKACSKDLGLYKCTMTTSKISVSASEYHLTSEVLMELVISSHDQTAEPRSVEGDEENIQCTPLLFKEDFLSDQNFGENQPASIVTEKIHFGEGMHRKAFRTTLRAGKLPRFNPGHPCVLKVHNSIGYGTKNTDELVQKNYSLAVEECHVQNTAREYIKAYNNVARNAESFGEVPEIIPIYLVHRPSNDIPYATLEEELMGDFVKYSVKDGKEINLMRRDSEAGQKCCAFQHWVYSQTEGNLLVTDMQGVGMKLTDVGIATCKKGYKGFRGNCATSFIDQFKALHQCNRFCELLGLLSLQPKPKRTVPPKPKAQPAPKKNPFGSVLNGKA